MPKTATTSSLTDPRMWRKALAIAHPDSPGGDGELFVWLTSVREHITGDSVENGGVTVTPPRQAPADEVDRVPFPAGADHEALTRRAVGMVGREPEPFGRLLEFLSDCREGHTRPLVREQNRGASYKRLAAIGHAAGFGKSLRVRWYGIAESVPLSDRHAAHILTKLQEAGS